MGDDRTHESVPASASAAPVPDPQEELRKLALRLAHTTSLMEAWLLKSQIDRLLHEDL